LIPGGAAFTAATKSARPGLRAALVMATAVRVAGSGPPSRWPTARAPAVISVAAIITRKPAVTVPSHPLISTRTTVATSSAFPIRPSRDPSRTASGAAACRSAMPSPSGSSWATNTWRATSHGETLACPAYT
jgi:hypothetical protein